MKCQYREKIGSLLMEDLEADERLQMERHLEGCQECRQERELLSETLQQLSSLQDEAVPHHFFIQPERARLGPWQLLSRLSPLWKGVLAAVALAMLSTVALAVSGLQVRVEDGALMAGFGPLPARPTPGLDQQQAAALAEGLLQAVDRRFEERDEALRVDLQRQLAGLQRGLSQEQRDGIEALLAGFEESLAQSWQRRDARLRLEVRDYVEAAYSDAQAQYRQDLVALGRQLEEFARRDDIQDERISLVSSAFMKIVESVE